jgi:hypothetical protein
MKQTFSFHQGFLYIAFLIFDNPPPNIKEQISILPWKSPNDVEKYLKQNEEKEKDS